jgi:hypothetical protein
MKNAEQMTALVEKYEDQEQFPRMIGTGGGMDYLIVAKNPEKGIQLGVKALIGKGHVDGKKAILCGIRLRSAFIDPQNANVANFSGGDEQEIGNPAEVYPFNWESVGQTSTGFRASLIRTLPLARGMEEAGWVLDDLDHVRFFGKLSAMLREHVPEEQFVVTDEDIKNYLIASYYPALLHMEVQYGNDPEKELELLDLTWKTKVEDHDKHKAAYEERRAELLQKIAEIEKDGAPQYHPKSHFGEEELIPLDGVATTMLKGTKPKLSLVTSEHAPSEGDESDSQEEETSSGSAFESTDEPDMSAEGAGGPGNEETAGDEPPTAA